MIFNGHFDHGASGIFEPLRETLLSSGDFYMHLADVRSYTEAQARVGQIWSDPDTFAEKAILNVASSGKFSSDRTIAQYASEIWGAVPCPVGSEEV
jgi:starch phosphorylase